MSAFSWATWATIVCTFLGNATWATMVCTFLGNSAAPLNLLSTSLALSPPTLLSPVAAACTTRLSCLCFGCCCVSAACTTGLSCQMPLCLCFQLLSTFPVDFGHKLLFLAKENYAPSVDTKATKLSFNNENLNPHKFKSRYTRFLSHITTSYSKLPC